MMKKALIFDGNSILNRAFYGVRPLNAPDGLPTNALYGFVGMVNKAFAQVGGADYAAMAFDVREKTFRHKAFASYKATRKPMPEELVAQLPFAHTLASALGLKVIECPGYEADDILGTLARELEAGGAEVYIVTGDRDSFQLVSDKVTVLLASNDETKIITPQSVADIYGVTPEKMIDIKALMGDTSDNISGVPGIGEKGAVKLITQYGGLDGVYAHAEEIAGALGKKLREGRQSAYDSKFLATICTSAPIGVSAEDCAYKGADIPALRQVYKRLGFSKYLEKLADVPAAAAEPAESEEYLPFGAEDFAGRTVFAAVLGEKLLVCCGGKSHRGGAELIRAAAKAEKTVCWSSKELYHAYAAAGATVPENAEDISLLIYVGSPEDKGISFAKSALDILGVSCTEMRVSLLPAMYEKLIESATEEGTRLYREVELPLSRVLFDMEARGFRVDPQALDVFSAQLETEISGYEAEIYASAGHEFNINSPKQLGDVLFEELGLPHYRKTKSGYSTDVSVLERLAPYHPIIQMIFEYRRAAKLKSTYCDGLKRQISADGRIHTTFKQTQTLTGRLSSAEPNLQNIPVRREQGRELRKFFIASEGGVLIDADYSQIELRILAHVSGDKALINAFVNGEDIHTVTASQVFGVPADSVTAEMRKRAKAVNFGIIYGIGDYSLSQDLHIPRRLAAEYIESYLAKYPGVCKYLRDIKQFARDNGYVETMFGRRRYVPEINNRNANMRAFGERVAMNTPIQGAAADLIKIAMIRADEMLASAGLSARLILQIHDELIIDSPAQEAARAAEILRTAMTGAASLAVPLSVDIGVGKSWFEAKN